MMLSIHWNSFCGLWLSSSLIWMCLSVIHKHWLGTVLVCMRHSEETLGIVETNHHQCNSSDQMLLIWDLLHMSSLQASLSSKKIILALIKLFLYVSAEHIDK